MLYFKNCTLILVTCSYAFENYKMICDSSRWYRKMYCHDKVTAIKK